MIRTFFILCITIVLTLILFTLDDINVSLKTIAKNTTPLPQTVTDTVTTFTLDSNGTQLQSKPLW